MVDKEIWKAVPLFEDVYEVSDKGRLRNIATHNCLGNRLPISPRILKQGNCKGYRKVTLFSGSRKVQEFVHRLVLLVFSGECPDGYEASHKDGDRGNNHKSNLVWESRKDNHFRKHQHGTAQCGENSTGRKLSITQAKNIKKRCEAGENITKLGKEYNVNRETIRNIYKGRTWQCLHNH